MSKRCIPGVICIENVTIIFVIVVLCIVLLFIHYYGKKNSNIHNNNNMPMNMGSNMPMNMGSNMPMNIGPNMPMNMGPPMQMPINVPTQPIFNTNYRQVGILTRVHGKETILPLMGRPVMSNRDKWNFYTINDSNNMVQLPITYKGRSCTAEYGCDNLSSGDIVHVEGLKEAFRVTAYENDAMRYIPYF